MSALLVPPSPAEQLRVLAERLTGVPAWVPEPHQVAPPGGWLYWLLVAGRGAGKTDAGAHYVDQHARGPACLSGRVPHRIAIAAPTLGDARLTCIKGESGLLRHNERIRFNHSDGILVWPNGAQARIFGAYTPEDVERRRGPQHCLVWADELAAWRLLAECWDQMRFGLRLGARPRVVATTTPRPLARLKALLADPQAVVTRAPTTANPHLHRSVKAELERRYGGTRLGRQELLAEVLDDADGAFWQRSWIDAGRVTQAPALYQTVTAVDPAVTATIDSDETAIVSAGMSEPTERCPACGGEGPHFFVLDAAAYRLSPAGWAKKALEQFDRHRAGLLILERNQGGDMVKATIQQVRPDAPLRTIVATKGKADRAMEVSILYEQGKVHHVGGLAALEDQQCVFPVASEHDDLVDALVYSLVWLKQRRGPIVIGESEPRAWK